MVKNTSTNIPLLKLDTVLPSHLQKMNDDGWELMFVFQRMTGIEETLFLIWKRYDNEVSLSGTNQDSQP